MKKAEKEERYKTALLPKIAFLLSATALCSFGIIMYWHTSTKAQDKPPSAEEQEAVARRAHQKQFLLPAQKTERFLEKLFTTVMPSERQRIIEEMFSRREELSGPLLRILGDPKHPYLNEAAQACGFLKIKEAEPFLLRLAKTGPSKIRFTALQYAGGADLSSQDLKDVLVGANPEFLVRGLEFINPEDVLMQDFLVNLLLHKDLLVRLAALRRFPRDLSEKHIQILIEHVMAADPGVDSCVILRALSWIRPRAQINVLFYDSLDALDPRTRVAGLFGLGTREKLSNSDAVWLRLESNASTREERVQALLTLETTDSVSVDRLNEVLPWLDTFERYFAARCLISKRDRNGLTLLFEILDLPLEERKDPKTRWDLLRPMVRNLFVQLSGTAKEKEWPDWARGVFEPILPLKKPKFVIWQL